MVPLEPDVPAVLTGTRVLLSNGRRDPIVPTAQADRLAALLREAGADVTVAWQPAGHELTQQDIDDARRWLDSRNSLPF